MDKTNHCTGCKERQDRIDELEAELAEADKHSARIEKLLLSSAEEGALKLAPEGCIIITQDELANLTAQLASVIAAGDALTEALAPFAAVAEQTALLAANTTIMVGDEELPVEGQNEVAKACSAAVLALANWTAIKGEL